MQQKPAESSDPLIEKSQLQFNELTANEVLKFFDVNQKTGLTEQQVEKLREIHGLNELAEPEKESIFEKIKEQFEDKLVRILLISAIISFVVSYFGKQDEHSIPAWVEPMVIFTILICNAIVGIYQDYDAEKALDALKQIQPHYAHVERNGTLVQIESKFLVPGDIIEVKQGDLVPADCRLLELKTITLRVNESIFTGEVKPVQKTIEPVKANVISEKVNLLYSGTTVVNGSALAIVTKTGMKSEIGKIQESIDQVDEMDTPLKRKLDQFGDTLAKVIGVICLVIWLMNFSNFFDPAHGNAIQGCLYYFKIAVALAVAAIPEGLPAVITTCLALGTRQMAKKQAIVRKLPSVQTLGCTTVICSDKTGTLTTNEMCVKNFFLFSNNQQQLFEHFIVEGETYSTQGKIQNMDEYLLRSQNLMTPALQQFTFCNNFCNDSKLMLDQTKNKIIPSGLPTEAALKVLNEKIGAYDRSFLNSSQNQQNIVENYNAYLTNRFQKIATLEFTRTRKSMSTLVTDKQNGKTLMFIKGAPDYLLHNAKQIMLSNGTLVQLNEGLKDNIFQQIHNYAANGLRTLAIAVKYDCGILEGYDGSHNHQGYKSLLDYEKYATLETSPIIIGIVGLQDPPRPDVKNAIKKCKKAGVSVIMITGDIKETAESIGTQIEIIQPNETQERSFKGEEFKAFSQDKQLKILEQVINYPSGLIFSRTEPDDKKMLVQLLSQKQNQIVAMTGDGVNDAPALAQANIGIAMGIAGTEVAKEASDMVLADDNFSTIVEAIEQGRAIYNNMKAFIRYMISSNIGEVVSIFLSSLLGIPDGFNSIQLLWVNLVTDGLPATALSFNPPDPDIMEKPPRKQDEPIITGWVFFRYMVIGIYVGISTVGIFLYWYMYYDWAGDNHTLINFKQLSNWSECQHWQNFSVKDFGIYDFAKDPCQYFTWGKQKPCTLALTTLVVIEMFNSLNALSEDSSLFKVGIFANIWLLCAIALSIILHCVILYIPFFATVFGTVPLTFNDWALVIGISFPVVIIDEILKFFARLRNKNQMARLQRKVK